MDDKYSTMRVAGRRQRIVVPSIRFAAIWGPGLLVMLADTDAGNIVTAAEAGARSGYRLLPLLLVLIPILYMIQELTVRLGIFTGRGYGELVRERFGAMWAWFTAVALVVSALASLVTEFTAFAGIGELYGLPRGLPLLLAAALLLFMVGTGSYRRIQIAALAIGIFEVAFFVVAWMAHPSPGAILSDAIDISFADRQGLYLDAAIIGAVFNPWMIFYQQSAIIEDRLTTKDVTAARWDTAVGAVLTQLLTGAVLVGTASLMAGHAGSFDSIATMVTTLGGKLASGPAKMMFHGGVLGAALVAAIVSSLALAWGVGEVAGYRRTLQSQPFQACWFYGVYVASITFSAVLVWFEPNLVRLNVAAQVLNAFLLPLVFGLLVGMAATALPAEVRLRGWYLWLVIATTSVVCCLGLIGGTAGLF